jgi:hypothetical protein
MDVEKKYTDHTVQTKALTLISMADTAYQPFKACMCFKQIKSKNMSNLGI